MATSETVIKFILGTNDVVSITGNSLSDLAANYANLSADEKGNLELQTTAAVFGVAGDVIPFPGFGAAGVGMSVLAFFSGYDVLIKDLGSAQLAYRTTGLTSSQEFTVFGDYCTVLGDVTGGMAGFFNLTEVAKPAGVLFSGISIGIGLLGTAAVIGDAASRSTIVDHLADSLQGVRDVVSQYGSLLENTFGSAATTLISDINSVVNSTAQILVDINSPADFLADVSAAASNLKALTDSFVSLFDGTGSTVPSVTVTQQPDGSVNVASGGDTASGDEEPNASTGMLHIVVTAGDGISNAAYDVAGATQTDGYDQTDNYTAGSSAGSVSYVTSDDGTTYDTKETLNGLNFSGSVTGGDMSLDENGSIVLSDFDDSGDGSASVSATANPDGTISIDVTDGSGSSQAVVTLNASAIQGDTIANTNFGDLSSNAITFDVDSGSGGSLQTVATVVSILDDGGIEVGPGTSSNDEEIVFSGSNGLLELDPDTTSLSLGQPAYPYGGIANFQAGDVIDLKNLQSDVDLFLNDSTSPPPSGATEFYEPYVTETDGSLDIEILHVTTTSAVDGNGNAIEQQTATVVSQTLIPFTTYQGYAPTSISALDDGNGGIEITTADAPCFAEGTRIATARGPVAVEELKAGDLVPTASGQLQRIRWIGYRHVDCYRHPDRRSVWPVRIRSGAFKAGIPARDLFLSPDHAIFAHGVLIPIKHLINEMTIVQEPRDKITYCHVELEQHDVIYADGLECESYLDNGSRSAFSNGGQVVQLHPMFTPAERCEAIGEAVGYAPLCITGVAVDRVRARLRRRATKLGYPLVRRSLKAGRKTRRPTISVDLAFLVWPQWYLSNNPDVAAAGADARTHYEAHGRGEGRLPCPEIELIRSLGLIEPATVIRTMPDVVGAGVDVVEHFCSHGGTEGRRPNAYFDTAWYRGAHRVPAGMNPLVHYVLFGEGQGLAPSRHFDPAWYRRRYGLAPSVCALAHYLQYRRTQQFSPLPSFDLAAHVEAHHETLRPNRDPYLHFLVMGQITAAFGRGVTA
jgi:hypothetical protein